MTNEELNRRCAFFARFSLPYSDTVWRLLAEAFDHGYASHKKGEQYLNPYQKILCRGEGPGTPSGS